MFAETFFSLSLIFFFKKANMSIKIDIGIIIKLEILEEHTSKVLSQHH